MTEQHVAGNAMERLCAIMEQLRSPSGCPWDASQTNHSLEPFLIEEAYEVLEAIQLKNHRKLCEELGDLLLQIVFHAQICSEAGAFTFADVASTISDKLVSRHPHVFAKEPSGEPHEFAWDRIKQQERQASGEDTSLLAGVPRALPALQRTQKVLAKTSRYGLPVSDLLTDGTLLPNQASDTDDRLALELLALTLSIHTAGQDAEQMLRDASREIEQHFTRLEQNLRDSGRNLQDLSVEEWRQLWCTT